MAFETAGWTTVAAGKSGNAPSVYAYKTTDAVTAVRVAGYFNTIRSLLQIGDIIFVSVLSGSALSTASILVVKDKSDTAVDTTDQLALTVTDTD
ncbi:hypothetical protein UFOVP375_39 [uncultured Caudovirales phage]|jgi:hypothetical protein|uniref:Uncharacterized protein n=1 Tax=uncultured Caudovirales phage TaxID=2100421 RepID=A0A6J7XSF4_9CAUD|nr:hypothetical protein UFOVP375_39 [uncultured Caudovirales phage]